MDLRIALYRQTTGPLQTSNPGRIFENTIIMSLPAQGASYDATPADVQAYDVRTGKVQWVFHSIPHPGEFGYDTWPPEAYKKSGGVHNWSESTVDEQRGIAFINFGSPRFDFYGGDRKGDNLFGNSLVAIDARTGRRIWHQQLVHHDLWDYDLPQAPKLLTIRQNGRNIDIVAQATKHGFLFVFERETGRPIWPIEERKVPQSDVPGECSSPTQPFPTKPAPFARQSFTEKDINPYLPAAERQAIAERMKFLRNEGLFTPPSFEGSISLPGHNGGANFQTSAVDPTRGEMYVFAKALPTVDRIALPRLLTAAGRGAVGRRWWWRSAGRRWRTDHHARAEGAVDQGRAGAGRCREGEGRDVQFPSPYEFMNNFSYSMTAIGPPWSEMTAYDLNTGEIKWRIPTGTVLAPPELGHPGEHRIALPAQRTARDRRRPGVLRDRRRSPLPRLRPRQRERGVVDRASRRVGRDAGDLRGQRPSVHRRARSRRATGQFAARFGGPPAAPAPRRRCGSGRGGGRGGAAPAGPPGQYMALALKK